MQRPPDIPAAFALPFGGAYYAVESYFSKVSQAD
jgi:hypothetical protein